MHLVQHDVHYTGDIRGTWYIYSKRVGEKHRLYHHFPGSTLIPSSLTQKHGYAECLGTKLLENVTGFCQQLSEARNRLPPYCCSRAFRLERLVPAPFHDQRTSPNMTRASLTQQRGSHLQHQDALLVHVALGGDLARSRLLLFSAFGKDLQVADARRRGPRASPLWLRRVDGV